MIKLEITIIIKLSNVGSMLLLNVTDVMFDPTGGVKWNIHKKQMRKI